MAIIHLVPSLPTGSSSLPGSASRRIGIETGRLISLPYLALHHEEFTWPHLLPDTPVGSYSTVSPITAGEPRLVSSLLHLSSSRRIGTPGRYPARCPMVFGLSSPTEVEATAQRASLQGFAILAKNVEHTKTERST